MEWNTGSVWQASPREGGCDSYQTPRAPRITGNNILLSTVYLIISRKEDELSPWHITMGVLGACGDAWHVRSQESHVWLVVRIHGHGSISVLGQASMGFVVTACRRLKGLIPCCSCRIDGPAVVIGISLWRGYSDLCLCWWNGREYSVVENYYWVKLHKIEKWIELWDGILKILV